MPKRAAKSPVAKEKAVVKKQSARKPAGAATGSVYQLKITLSDIDPPIWRRVQTLDCTLAKLHDIIQISMGWGDCHLHLFEIGGEQYGLPEQWDEGDGWGQPDIGSSLKLKLSQLVARGVKKFKYMYDMGDSWEHTIQVEKTPPPETAVKYPHCITGQRACPPEDCGGPWGYGDFLEAIQDPKHPEHEEMLEWAGGQFDPEAFDMKGVNEQLKNLR